MIQGNCLCGSVAWQLDGEPAGATACNCTVELQRKVSHYLQPILSHRFLNNLA